MQALVQLVARIFLWSLVSLAALNTRESLGASACDERPPSVVSLVSLIATPERYQGWCVQTSGFLGGLGENARLFLTHDDLRYSIMENSVAFDTSTALKAYPRLRSAVGEAVLIEGVFHDLSVKTPLEPEEIVTAPRGGFLTHVTRIQLL